MVEVRVVQEGLGGNAADIETCAAERAALFYASNLCPGEPRDVRVTG